MTARRRLPYFAELDGIRALAALMVFFNHFFQAGENSMGLASKIARFGSLGVQSFFVLSGFLITSLLFLERRDSHMLHDFYWKRVLRIWPALLLHLVGFGLLVGWARSRGYIILSLLFVANFASRFGVSMIGPTWSLAIEEQFYLLWPQIIRSFKVKTVFWFSLCIALTSILLRLIVPLCRHGAIDIIYTPYQCDGLALGAILACQWFGASELEGTALRIIRFLNGGWSLALWVVLLMLRIPLRNTSGIDAGILILLAVFLTYRVMYRIVMRSTGNHSRWIAWLGWKPLVFMGSISYGFYLYHALILNALKGQFGAPDMSRPGTATVRLALAFGVSVLVSYGSLRFIELPIRRLRSRVIHDKALQPGERATVPYE
jgi:peptidoglycan/LPS O-acetylase OafA/YrhL